MKKVLGLFILLFFISLSGADCVQITIDEMNVFPGSVPGNIIYESYYTPQTGDEDKEDVIQFILSDAFKKGDYDLSTEINSSLKNCKQCVIVLEDIDVSGDFGKVYFPERGTLTVTESIEPSFGIARETAGVAKNVKLVEIAILDAELNFEKVENGECIEIVESSWDTVCKPNCKDGQVCGSDGCGGICGEGCGENKMCNSEGTACIDYDCEEITLDELTDTTEYTGVYESTFTPNIGEDTKDVFFMEIYSAQMQSGSYDLASSINNNYEYCEVCLTVFEDDTAQGAAKGYFQQKGTVTFSEIAPEGDFAAGTIENVRLIEVAVDGFYNSKPVMGGACLDVVTHEFDHGRNKNDEPIDDEADPSDDNETPDTANDTDDTKKTSSKDSGCSVIVL